MNFKYTLLISCCVLFTIFTFAQTGTLSGIILDAKTNQPLIGATVRTASKGAVTEVDGHFALTLPAGKHTLTINYIGYETMTKKIEIIAGETQKTVLRLSENPTLLQTATVTSGKYEKPLSEVTVSLQVIQPQLLESVNTTSLDEVLGKVPGVEIIDGQANIRGGSGFSYGAGSRVLLLVDDIPILQADAGFPQWDDIPVESIGQIEIVKGAASALYGSAALNGIINVRTAYATSQPVTQVATFGTIYDDFKDKEQIWYEEQPHEYGFSFSHKQKFDKLDVVLGGYYLNRESFNKATYNRYARFNANLRYHLTDRFLLGVNTNFNPGKSSNFFFWKGLDSLYVPGNNTISKSERFRYNIDPFVSYYDNSGNRHKLMGRYYYINNDNNGNRSNQSNQWYTEYQFLREWKSAGLVSTAGLVYTGNNITAELYGDTTLTASNFAAYAQLDKKLNGWLNLSAGFRFEHNAINHPTVILNYINARNGQLITEFYPAAKIVDSKPVWRLGANAHISEATYLRASWGQGYRYPTVAESFIRTTFGGIPILPNPALTPETGWSAEMGIKQGYRIRHFEGYLDIAGFWSRYNNMMEFNISNKIDPAAGLPGFQSQNIGGTDIRGFEFTVAGQGNFFGLPTTILAGYTYLDPKFEEFDTEPVPFGEEPTEGQHNAVSSSSDENILKYRYQHTAKADIESRYKQFSIGIAVNYNSFIEAVDAIFEDFIVPGLKTYRQENNHGNTVLSARAAYRFWDDTLKVSLLVNNTTNLAYSNRPGIMEAPRSFGIRLDGKF